MKHIYDLKSEKIKVQYLTIREFVALFLILLLVVIVILLIFFRYKESESSFQNKLESDIRNVTIDKNHSEVDMYFHHRQVFSSFLSLSYFSFNYLF